VAQVSQQGSVGELGMKSNLLARIEACIPEDTPIEKLINMRAELEGIMTTFILSHFQDATVQLYPPSTYPYSNNNTELKSSVD
jgi:hypothetical protein